MGKTTFKIDPRDDELLKECISEHHWGSDSCPYPYPGNKNNWDGSWWLEFIPMADGPQAYYRCKCGMSVRLEYTQADWDWSKAVR